MENIDFLVRQFVSTTMAILALAISLVFAKYLMSEYNTIGWRALRSQRINQASIALMVYFGAMALRFAWLSYLYSALRVGGDPILVEVTYPIALGASIIAVVGGLCVVRVFTRNRLTWLYILGIVLFFAGVITAVA